MMTRVMHVGALAALSVLVLSLGASCAGERRAAPKAGMGGMNDITLRLTPGPAYKFTSRWFIFPVAIYPQVACWLETPQGEYVDTLYVTAKGAERTWVSAPPGGRPEALPVWSHLPKGKAADAVSGPTPSGATTRSAALGASLQRGNYVVKLEVNRSYDYNERYTRDNSGVTGQPSLIYACELETGGAASSAVFKAIGTGAVDGSDGDIRQGLEGITTALQLLDSAEIFYEGGAK
jgi:hypothetical protein